MVYIYMAIKILLDHSNELYYYIIRTNVLLGFVKHWIDKKRRIYT